jgi:hypothetical protein
VASLAWHHERLDEMCARVSAEAASKAERIILSMERQRMPWRVQREHFYRTGEWPEADADGVVRWPYSSWELSRIMYPKMMADLDALGYAEIPG